MMATTTSATNVACMAPALVSVAAVPGSRSLSLRRYSELFPGVAPRDLEQAVEAAQIEPTPHALIADLRRRVLVAERYLTEMSRAAPKRR